MLDLGYCYCRFCILTQDPGSRIHDRHFVCASSFARLSQGPASPAWSSVGCATVRGVHAAPPWLPSESSSPGGWPTARLRPQTAPPMAGESVSPPWPEVGSAAELPGRLAARRPCPQRGFGCCGPGPCLPPAGPPYLIEDNETPAGGVVQDIGDLLHLHQERAASCGDIVGGADAREDAVHEPHARAGGGNKRPDARQQRDQRRLAQIGRFTGHVR